MIIKKRYYDLTQYRFFCQFDSKTGFLEWFLNQNIKIVDDFLCMIGIVGF